MNYLSVCSGIEAATVAWHHMGWKPVGFSEIEKFPSQVLAHHYPTVTNFGDMTKYKEGKCYCEKSCITADKTKCISVSISIFRPGSIIITAGKDVKQLVRVYDYLNTMFKKHFATISYVDVHDNKDHFLLNEERKIMRKDNLVYIKKSDIRISSNNLSPMSEANITAGAVCTGIDSSAPNVNSTATGVTRHDSVSGIAPTIKEPEQSEQMEIEPKQKTEQSPVTLTETPKLDLSSLMVSVKLKPEATKAKRVSKAKQ
jgi:DNA (cytosine-5)-methyltransferase 1